MITNDLPNMADPKNGINGVDKIELKTAWTNSIAECGTENGCANAWKADLCSEGCPKYERCQRFK